MVIREEGKVDDEREKIRTDYIKNGYKLISDEDKRDWETFVNYCIDGINHFNQENLFNSYELIYKITKGFTKESINNVINRQNHSRSSYRTLKRVVTNFVKDSNNYFDYYERCFQV